MIKNFGDHAANERTFLAWVRTAIAVMAFGYLVEKFDLFLELAAPNLSRRTLSGARPDIRQYRGPFAHCPGHRDGGRRGRALHHYCKVHRQR